MLVPFETDDTKEEFWTRTEQNEASDRIVNEVGDPRAMMKKPLKQLEQMGV